MFEVALVCFSVSLAPLSTYPLLRTIDKVTSIHPHIWISFSLVSMVNNRTKGLGWVEAGRTMQEHLCCLHTLFEHLFCLGIKNLWQLWRSYNSFSATKRLKPKKAGIVFRAMASKRLSEGGCCGKNLSAFYDMLWNRTRKKLGWDFEKLNLSLACCGLSSHHLPVPGKMLL